MLFCLSRLSFFICPECVFFMSRQQVAYFVLFFFLSCDKSIIVDVARSHRSRVGVRGRSFFLGKLRACRGVSPARFGRW